MNSHFWSVIVSEDFHIEDFPIYYNATLYLFLAHNVGGGPQQTMDRVRKTAKAVRSESFTSELLHDIHYLLLLSAAIV